jgi:DNA-binding response OmpR family regulator
MSRILVVEDDAAIATSLSEMLAREGHDVVMAKTIAEAQKALTPAIELVLLDWMLPDGQGVDLLKAWRKSSDVPVILVTARADLVDRVVGLEIGADDYVTKPFEARELTARIKARLRGRGDAKASAAPQTLSLDGVTIDLASREVTFRGAPVDLTRMELGLLRLLMENPTRVFTRDELLNRVWGYERAPTTRTVDAHVLALRTKLDPALIVSVRGVGYRFRKTPPAEGKD